MLLFEDKIEIKFIIYFLDNRKIYLHLLLNLIFTPKKFFYEKNFSVVGCNALF